MINRASNERGTAMQRGYLIRACLLSAIRHRTFLMQSPDMHITTVASLVHNQASNSHVIRWVTAKQHCTMSQPKALGFLTLRRISSLETAQALRILSLALTDRFGKASKNGNDVIMAGDPPRTRVPNRQLRTSRTLCKTIIFINRNMQLTRSHR